MEDLLKSVNHRPYPIPGGNWIMSQEWNKLLFAHWRFSPDAVRELIPGEMELDLFDSSAWVAVVPFKMENVRFRYIPLKCDFLELNVRTYVKYQGRPGVYFFSLDASMPLAVEAARLWFGLPYLHATMSAKLENEIVHYVSQRKDRRGNKADLKVRYHPKGKKLEVSNQSIENFLTERYCLFVRKGKNMLRGEIHHKKWSLTEAGAEFQENTMLEAIGLKPSGDPLLHYSEGISTIEWSPVRL